MSLRGGRELKEKRIRESKTFRFPPELLEYIKEAAKAPLRDQTEVITSAIELDRDLDQKLHDEAERLTSYAGEHGLEMHSDLAEILARLVRRGLESYEREKKKKVR